MLIWLVWVIKRLQLHSTLFLTNWIASVLTHRYFLVLFSCMHWTLIYFSAVLNSYIYQDEKNVINPASHFMTNSPELRSEISQSPVGIIPNVTGPMSPTTLIPSQSMKFILFLFLFVLLYEIHLVSVLFMLSV